MARALALLVGATALAGLASCSALKPETITVTHFDVTTFAAVERQITAGKAEVF
jgi:ribosome recycling factor